MTNHSSTSTSSSNYNSLKALAFNSVGQLQTQRALPTLIRDAFHTEQRDFVEWMAYLRTIAKDIRFFDIEQQAAVGSWQSALPSAEQAIGLQALMDGRTVSADIQALANRPDIASLMAYYHMLRYPIAQMQRFTQQHLDYYYQEVLGFQAKAATPDRAHVVLKLDDSAKSVTLLKGAQFDGGQDSAGNPLIYETLSNSQFNQAELERVLSLSRLTDGGQLLLTDGVNSPDDILMPEEGIFSFGEPALHTNNAELSERQTEPEQGLELSSSCLYLSGGERNVNIEFVLSNPSQVLPIALSDLFTVSISTAEGLVLLQEDVQGGTEHASVTWSDTTLSLTFGTLFAPITGIEAEPPRIELPKIELQLKPQWLDNAELQQLRRGLFAHIHVQVAVSKLPGAILGQAGNVLDGEAPFHPFGLNPRTASRFDFTHPELLCKTIEQAHVNVAWLDRPDNWDDYYFAYRVYQNQNIDYSNSSMWELYPSLPAFNVDVLYSDQVGSISLSTPTELFSQQAPVNNIDKHRFTFIEETQYATTDYAALPLGEKRPMLWPKYFSLQLNQPDFGHQVYPQVGQYAAQLNTQNFANEEYSPLLVFPPYTPLLDNITVDYTCRATFSADATIENVSNNTSNTVSNNTTMTDQTGALSVYHVHPLGRPVVNTESNGFSLLPRFDLRGYIYLGIGQVQLPSQVRLYFQLDPVDNSNIVNAPRIDWHYLTDQGWQFFDNSTENSARIIEDSTFQLLDSGVVTFEFPTLDFNNNFIDGKCLWIRIGIADDSVVNNENHARYSRIRNIYSQGVEVQLVDENISPDHYSKPLPEGSVSGMINGPTDVAEVTQHYPSYGAKPKESKSEFQIRASERLRHKQRALLAWDYERLILAEFPQVYLTRCFSLQQDGESSVALVVVPINHNPDILQPKVPLYLKRKIQRFVNTVSPDGVNVVVKDPVYEEVAITLYAQISSDFDKERAEGELNSMLLNLMTPWNYSGSTEADTSNDSDKKELRKDLQLTYLAQQLEQHPALEKVYVVRAKQTTESEIYYYPDSKNGGSENNLQRDNVITASNPQSILVPAKVHDINLFNSYQPIFEGVGKWRLELDWKVR